jgi:predicted house-cleaning noncanonical NTP pyrophosphatase (MazG superfamily)
MAKEHKKNDLQNLPACAAEFIRQVLRKMRYRRSVRQDVQAELAAHFEDELKDYATDEEKEQKAQQLIAEFGDVKLLAVLLRRAKNAAGRSGEQW